MLQNLHAIYENGVLRPLGPLKLEEHQEVVVSVAPVADSVEVIASAQRKAMEKLDAALAGLPDNSPEDDFSAADHDRILYGQTE